MRKIKELSEFSDKVQDIPNKVFFINNPFKENTEWLLISLTRFINNERDVT